MKILFIGSVDFSYHVLKKLINMKSNIIGVCTLEKSSFNSDFCDLTPLSKMNNIPVRYTQDINSKDNLEWIKSLDPDIIFCLGWSRLLKTKILNISNLGVVGYHPTELPFNRGRHPLIWSLALGLKKTASTFFFMDEGADSGDILSQKTISISKKDDAKSLYKKMIDTSLIQIENFLPNLISGKIIKKPQDSSLSNTWRKRSFIDGKIDWRMSAESIYNLVRSLSHPYIGAHFEFDGKIIKLWKVKIIINKQKNIEPGKVLMANKSRVVVKTGKDSIEILDFSPKIKVFKGQYI